MKLPHRRQVLHLAASAAALPAVSRIGRAQAYPTRPVHVIVGFTAGNNIDIVARLIGQWLSERLGQPFIIENRPGASGNIAAEAVVRAPADGHTLLMTGTFNAINATLYENLSFNFIRDIAPSRACRAPPASWKSALRSRPRPSLSSSPTRGPIPVTL
jgi:tripartite-type tricarboxylate transporter receptor subunit TctC